MNRDEGILQSSAFLVRQKTHILETHKSTIGCALVPWEPRSFRAVFIGGMWENHRSVGENKTNKICLEINRKVLILRVLRVFLAAMNFSKQIHVMMDPF